jgi:hypothetical protein
MTHALAIGTFEDARALVGRIQRESVASGPVNASMIKFLASTAEDANPSYWDEGFAGEEWGGLISPPSMLVHRYCRLRGRPANPKGGTWRRRSS